MVPGASFWRYLFGHVMSQPKSVNILEVTYASALMKKWWRDLMAAWRFLFRFSSVMYRIMSTYFYIFFKFIVRLTHLFLNMFYRYFSLLCAVVILDSDTKYNYCGLI